MIHIILRACVLLYALINVVYYFFPFYPLLYLLALILAYILVVSIGNMPRSNQVAVAGLFGLATALLAFSGADVHQWLEGLNKNGLLISLFTFGAMLHIPFRYHSYHLELKNLAKLYMRSILSFHLLISIPTHLFAAITGFAALGIMYHLFYETSQLYRGEDAFIATLVRSYATSGFWGTSWASVALAVSYLGLPWHRIILVGMLCTAVAFALNLGSLKLQMVRDPHRYPTLSPDKDTVVDWRQLGIMLSLILAVVLITLAVNLATGWSLLAIVPLVSMAFPPAVALLQKKGEALRRELRQFGDKSLYKSRSNVCLFASAGLLAYALEVSGAGAVINRLIPAAFVGRAPLMVLSLMLLMILPGQLGIHPVATGTTLVASIQPQALGLSVPAFALTIITGWLLSNMTSPFSALNLTISGLSGKNTWYTGLRLNWRYSLVCLLVYSLLIPVLSPLLG